MKIYSLGVIHLCPNGDSLTNKAQKQPNNAP